MRATSPWEFIFISEIVIPLYFLFPSKKKAFFRFSRERLGLEVRYDVFWSLDTVQKLKDLEFLKNKNPAQFHSYTLMCIFVLVVQTSTSGAHRWYKLC